MAWSEDFPGIPGHIRQSGRGGYWVALTYPRHSGDVAVRDQSSRKFWKRNPFVKERVGAAHLYYITKILRLNNLSLNLTHILEIDILH